MRSEKSRRFDWLSPLSSTRGGNLLIVKLTIELERESDGRWIAEVPELNLLLYRHSKQDAIQKAQSVAREILLDRIAHGELPPDSENAQFDIARHEHMAFSEKPCVSCTRADLMASRPLCRLS